LSTFDATSPARIARHDDERKGNEGGGKAAIV